MIQDKQATGLTTAHMAQLCGPEQIEHTMRLLYTLNHWAKARERLFFADRQGLYRVKAAILSQAYAAGHIEARAYIDGRAGFGAELAFDMAATIAAEGVVWRLEGLASSPIGEGHDISDQLVRQFYTRVTGKTGILPADVEALDARDIEAYIRARLEELERDARATRQPIPYNKLMELCIAPCDLLCLQDRRFYHLGSWDSWNQLDASDLRKLDPEGLSLIAFHYISPHAHYVFHQPLSLARAFLPAWRIAQLQDAPQQSRESGEYYGRAITEAESLQQPIAEILRELEVDIMATCPRHLSDKQEYLLTQALYYRAWHEEQACDDDDEEELDDEFWQASGASNHRYKAAQTPREPDACPLCSTIINAPGGARSAHWQQEHPGQNLTISQARWILHNPTTKEQFSQHYPPDYRTPDEKGQGTRYWRVETLIGWLQTNKVGKEAS